MGVHHLVGLCEGWHRLQGNVPDTAALPAAAMLTTNPTAAERPGVDSMAVPGIATMGVDIWPEYDDPRVLVTCHGLLAPGHADEVLARSPAGARIHMAGGIAEGDGQLHGDFRTEPHGSGLMTVTYRLEVPVFYMEFCYDPFTGVAGGWRPPSRA